MKITKKNGNISLYDDEKVVNSILKANAEVETELLTREQAVSISDRVFSKLTAEKEIITTEDVRACVYSVLREKRFPLTAKHYMNFKK